MSHLLPGASPVPTDDVLVALVRAGDAAGLGGIYARHATRMLRVAWRLTGSMGDAEDVVHDVFLELSDTLRRDGNRGTLSAWLAQVTARAALERVRSRHRRREADLSNARAFLSDSRTDLAAEYADLEREIAALPDALREIEGFSHDEIADLLGISAGASRVRLSRALVALRRALQPAAPPPPDVLSAYPRH